jgi:hypothetical protein
VDLYMHSPIRIHDVVHNYLSTGYRNTMAHRLASLHNSFLGFSLILVLGIFSSNRKERPGTGRQAYFLTGQLGDSHFRYDGQL